MASRILPAVLALLLVGDGEIERDPFLAALAGKSGPGAVAAPSFDPDLEAVSWSLRPRREVVDALAARLLRGEAAGWYEPAKDLPGLPAPPSRIPADFDPGKLAVADRLAAWVPADAAVVFFGSLAEAHEAVEEASRYLPRMLPKLCADPPGGKREALRRAVEMLLLPTIWGSNPEVRSGTRQVALVVSDPDLRWAPEIALLAEVDDASLVLAHRQATFSWEDRGSRRLRLDGLDAAADDGSVRSYFALEGGVAVWSTTRALRERVLAAGHGSAPSLLAPPAREYALARRACRREAAVAHAVVPDAFLARVGSAGVRLRRASALRCEAARRLLEARVRAGSKEPGSDVATLACPSGGELCPRGGGSEPSCSLHGTADRPAPLGDLPAAAPSIADREALSALAGAPDPIRRSSVPPVLLWDNAMVAAWIPGGERGRAMLDLAAAAGHGAEGADEDRDLLSGDLPPEGCLLFFGAPSSGPAGVR